MVEPCETATRVKEMMDKPIEVLLVEDNPGDARLIKEFLSDAGGTAFEIEVAQKLSHGLGALSEKKFDVILLDLSLPDSSGLETVAKALSYAQQTAIIVLTGLDDEKLAVDAVRKGAQDYLVKGQIDTDLLSRAIRYAIERKGAEEEKSELQAQLQRAQKMEAIGTLAGGVAHDLNNVLSGIVSYPDLILMQIPPDSPIRKFVLSIQESGKKAAAIVQDLLTLARRGVAVTEIVNLNHIISEYLKSPEHQNLKSYHPAVEIGTSLEPDLLNILGSPVHLSKTIMNLISNAAEAMPEGGKILISAENRYVDRPVRGYDEVEKGDYVSLSVSDTGVGISPKEKDRIFEPFYTKKKMGRSGTGLGMAVVWGTVKDHKGYIDLQSAEEKGTTFTLYFPVTREKPAQDQSPLPIENYKGRGESVLVVDDVKEQREIAVRILSELGYSVTTVSSGEEAVDYMRNNSADILVLDMIMDPGIDGLEAYKRIVESRPGQKAIIASGFSETERVKEAQRLGAGAYVQKPFLLEKIGVIVRTELDK